MTNSPCLCRSDVTTDERTSTDETQLSQMPIDHATRKAECNNSGLTRPEPKCVRGIPEGMEGEGDKNKILSDSAEQELVDSECGPSIEGNTIGEVYVKTTWSLRELFWKSRTTAGSNAKIHAVRQSSF